MAEAPRTGLPPLAGVCTLKQAALVGYSVDENVVRLQRYHWVLRRLGALLVERLPGTPEWEAKCAFALHQWQDAEHADGLRTRIGELRSPAPSLDSPPAAELESFLAELHGATDTAELIAGVYGVARMELVRALRRHLEETNPLVDQPTCRLLRSVLREQEEAVAWGEQAQAALRGEASGIASWQRHLRDYLEAAGGVPGDEVPRVAAVPPSRAPVGSPDMTPRRDARFEGSYDFDFPPHIVYNLPAASAAERNLALLCKRLLEMDVPEMMASFLTEDQEMPWEHQRAYRRQLWDEARHAMMGEAAFEARGIDWTKIPLNIGFSLRLNLHATPRERELMLYAIEQSLMPGETGKRFEYETARKAGDALSALFHDYDWADEVVHARTGRRWLRTAGLLGQDTLEQGRAVHERTWRALDPYRRPGDATAWWRGFVRDVLGIESALRAEDVHDPQVLPGA